MIAMIMKKMICYDRYVIGLDLVHQDLLDVGLGKEDWR